MCKDVSALKRLGSDEPEHNAGSTRSLNSAARPARLLQFTVSKSAQGQTPRKNDTPRALEKSCPKMGTVVHLGGLLASKIGRKLAAGWISVQSAVSEETCLSRAGRSRSVCR